MIDLPQIIEVAKQSEYSPLALELKTNSTAAPKEGALHVQLIGVPNLHSRGIFTVSYYRQLLGVPTHEQRAVANFFIKAMHDAYPDTVAVNHILRSERIRPHLAITSKQVIRAHHKLVLLEKTSYQFVDDGKNTNHKKLKFIYGLVLKLKTFFR